MTPEEFDVLFDRFLSGRLAPEEGERLRACLGDPFWKRRWRDLSDLEGMLADEFQGTAREGTGRPPSSIPIPAPAGRRVRASPAPPLGAWAAAAVLVAAAVAALLVALPRPPQRQGSGGAAPAPDAPEAARRENERLEETRRKIEEHLAALERCRQRLAAAPPARPAEPAEEEGRKRELERIDAERKALEEEMLRRIQEARRTLVEAAPAEPPPRAPEPARPAETRPAVARLGRLRGPVTLLAAGAETAPRPGGEILEGEGLRTAGDGDAAEVLLPDGTRLDLGGATTLGRIDRTGILLERGILAAEVPRRPAGPPLAFTTPHAEAQILGTRLTLVVTPAATRLEVREGRVRLRRLRDGATTEVSAGHEAIANGRGPLATRPLPALTLSFQDGVSPDPGYAGTRDVSITALQPNKNLGASETLGADGDDKGRDISALLRWDVTAIPPGSRVRSAEITLYITGTTGADTYRLYEMRRPWSESEATWKMASAGHGWQSAGARGGADRGPVPLGWISAPSKGERTILLNDAGLAVVQSWVNAPSANFGLIITESAARNGLDFCSRESPSPARRPRLTVTYDPPGRR